MSEDYCSSEIIKLLKEKGFKCGATYSKGFVKDGDGFVGGLVRHEDKITHQMAMKWLREVHKIFISIGIGDDIDGVFGYMAEIYCLEGLFCPYGEYRYIPNVDANTISDKTATTYEEEVEAALRYSLEKLI